MSHKLNSDPFIGKYATELTPHEIEYWESRNDELGVWTDRLEGEEKAKVLARAVPISDELLQKDADMFS